MNQILEANRAAAAAPPWPADDPGGPAGLTDLIHSIACVRNPFALDPYAGLVGAYGRTILEAYIERFSEQIGTSGPTIASYLALVPEDAGIAFWTPQIGVCKRAIFQRSDEAAGRQALAQTLLNLVSAGIPGQWELAFSAPAVLHWRHRRLPETAMLAVHSDGEQAVIWLNGTRLEQAVGADCEPDGPAAGDHAMASLHHGQGRILLPNEAEVRAMWIPNMPVPCVAAVEACHVESLRECLELLDAEPLRHYREWITRAAHTLSLVNSPPATLNSGSFEGMPGLIYLTGIASRVKTSEMLIHECAHQYFHMLGALTPFAEDDGTLYYSPFVRRPRPVDKLLVAYHAFANVEIFYRDCILNGLDVEECIQGIPQFHDDLNAVEAVLEKATSLTRSGRALFDSLRSHRDAAAKGAGR